MNWTLSEDRLLYRLLVAVRAVPPPPKPMTWESVFGSSDTLLAGVSIDESNALNYSPVWCGVSMLSRDIAKLPLMFYRNLKNGGKEPFKEHRLYRILHDEPNPEMSSFKFRETMQALCLLYGNAYAEIVRDLLDRPVGMYPIVPTRVQPMRNEAGRLFYRVTNYRGGQTDVAAKNMLHLSSLSTDGVIGHGIVQHARESFGLGVATERFGAAFFGNGSTFGGVVEVPGTLKDEQARDSVRKMIEAVHAGVERAHKILVLAGGSKFTERGTKPDEAQFIETRKFQITETARWLTMPPHKLGDLENAHFTNIEEENIQYHVGTVSGWLEMWEQELTRKLVSPLEYAQQTIEHNTEGALRGDSTKRADFYSKMYAIGAFSINDILRKENMNPIGPEGDMHLVPLNMIPAERYGEWIDVTIAEKKTPTQTLLPSAPDAERMITLQDEIRAALARTEEHVTRAVSAEAKAAQELEQRATWQAAAEREQAAAREAAEEARTAQRALVELQAARDQALEAQAEEVRQREAAQVDAVVANVARLEAAQLAEQRSVEVETARRGLAEALTQANQASALVDTLGSERAAAVAEAEEARQALATRELALAEAQKAVSLAAALSASTRAQADALDASLTERKAAERDRLTRVVVAHRALIVDVVGRMLRPEMDRARRRQGTPESLRKWAQAFYQTHRDVCAEALYPAVLTHLAWKRSDEDPRVVARSMAEAHCAFSERQLETVLTGAEPEDFHAALEQLLLRWEQERPNAAADSLLADEIRYIGSLS
jgi:HK97 family phage portal protein